MKKGIIILLLLAFAATSAFAQIIPMSVGGGGLFDWSFNNGVETNIGGKKDFIGKRNMSFGGFAFFDATYAEAEAGFSFGLLTAVDKKGTDKAGSMLQINFSVLGKYPFDFGKVTVFPLLGASYNMVFAEKDKNGDKGYETFGETMRNVSQFGLLGGAGVDYDLMRYLYLRVELLYHLRFANKETRDLADVLDTSAKFGGGSGYATLGMGPKIKVGLGYRF